jgi:hypothetical protein
MKEGRAVKEGRREGCQETKRGRIPRMEQRKEERKEGRKEGRTGERKGGRNVQDRGHRPLSSRLALCAEDRQRLRLPKLHLNFDPPGRWKEGRKMKKGRKVEEGGGRKEGRKVKEGEGKTVKKGKKDGRKDRRIEGR